MKRHAYLVMAHNQIELLIELLKSLDVNENDIYLHIDAKSDIDINNLNNVVKQADLYFTDRISVYWGGYSQIEATLILLKEAIKTKHVYYHMLSGVDLPLKNIKQINAFYNKSDREFIRFFSQEKAIYEYPRRFEYKNIFRDKFGRSNSVWKYVNRICYEFQRLLKIKDDRLKGCFFLGYSSWDITHELAQYVVEKQDYIRKTFKWTSCCDEVFLNTLIYGTKYWSRLYIPYSEFGTGMEANMRYINFKNDDGGSPYTIRKDDIQGLIESELNFARKFDENNYNAIYELKKRVNGEG